MWIIEVAIGNLTRYWSTDRDLVCEARAAKTYTNLAEATKQARELKNDHGAIIAVKTKRSA
ncbi:MAG: hypothetical protein M3Z05_21915 [Gemmatimonadota bacterium]|nr:hypothetical protein [Gemmatimonadota bacterium]